MRLAFSVIGSLVWLLLSLPAAGWQNVLTNEWTLDLGSPSDSAPAIAPDGTIYVGSWRGYLWAIDPHGTPKWFFRAQDEIKSAPAVGSDGSVYFGSRDRRLYAVRADGKKRWEFQTRGWVDSSPALAHDGTVYFGSWDKGFYALNPDGKERWRFTASGEIVSSPAIGADGTIYFGSHDRKLYALAPDGHKRWEFAAGGAILSSPALNRDHCLYFTSVDGCLYALNLDGTLRWRLRTGGTTESSPVIGMDGTIYLGVAQHLWAISPEGKKLWGSVGGEDYPFDASPVVLASGRICCVTRNGMLCYETPKGEIERQYYLYCYGYGSPAVGPNGNIYVPDCGAAAASGFTSLRAGVALASSPWPKFRGNARNTGSLQDALP